MNSNWAITLEATKNICCVKGEGTFDHGTITRLLRKFCLGCKNLNNHAISSWPKTMDSKTVLQAIETNPVGNTWKVSGKHVTAHHVWSSSGLWQLLNCAPCY